MSKDKETIPCLGFKTWTDMGDEYDCGYNTCISCDNCVCCGGDLDPRYTEEEQPKKLSELAKRTKNLFNEKQRKIYKPKEQP